MVVVVVNIEKAGLYLGYEIAFGYFFHTRVHPREQASSPVRSAALSQPDTNPATSPHLTRARDTFDAMSDLSSAFPAKPKLASLWVDNLNLAFLNRLPNRYQVGRRRRAKSKTTYPDFDDLTTLKTSFNFWDGLRDLQKHQWRLIDLQYVFLTGLTLFSLWIAPSAPAIKMFSLMGAVWVLLMPATRQFFLPSLMIWVWLVYFFCSR